MTVINTNVKSLVAQDAISKNNVALSTAMQRLSTGNRINSAKDDAAGLAISTRMTSQVRGLNMAVRNANDGISLMQTTEGAMDEVTSILQRMRELAVQSVNGTNNNSDRVALNDEVTQLKAEIDRIAKTTQFNNQAVLDGSFAGKKLQIGDKAGQTMAVDIASIQTKDLGMSQGSFDNKTLVSARVGSSGAFAAVAKGNITINDQELGEIKSTDDLGDVIKNINLNVDNVQASGFNTVVAKQIGDGITTDGQLQIKVQNIGNKNTTSTTYSIKASSSMQELIDNINTQAGAQVQASINKDGKLVLSNTTGGTISVSESSGTANTYETASGFKRVGTGVTGSFTDFAGFLKLDSKDGSPIRIDAGNLGASTPGSQTDLAQLGFRQTTSLYAKGVDAYTVSGSALTTAGASTAWDQNALQINGVNIYNQNINTDTWEGKIASINNFTNQTGVIAKANIDTTISMTSTALAATAAQSIKFNGVTVYSKAANTSVAVNPADVASAINTHTSETHITATVSGNNIRLTGTDVGPLKIEEFETTTALTSGILGAPQTVMVGIRLDSVTNSPISISLGDNQVDGSIGLLEQNVGAADFQINSPTLGVGSGSSLSGLNVSSLQDATNAISTIDNAIEKISSARSKLGAMENRLNDVVNNLTNISTNTAASRSRIQDTDYAQETTALAKSQIISQAATAMLAQANQQPQTVLSLLK
jgi:flagellin